MVRSLHKTGGALPVLGLAAPDANEAMVGELIHAPLTQSLYERMKLAAGGMKNMLLLMTLRATGLRPVEVVNLQARHLGHEAGVYWLSVLRAKKRGDARPEALFITPNLGSLLVEWVRWQQLRPMDSLFGIKVRRLRNVVYESSERALGFRVQPKAFRRFYIRSVAEIAGQVLGFTPRHMEVAQKMVGHESVRTTWSWYHELTVEERRRIQEAVQV
jgi:integrase